MIYLWAYLVAGVMVATRVRQFPPSFDTRFQ
jgi:hypothetical protein